LYFAIVGPAANYGAGVGAAWGVCAWSWISALMYAVVGFESINGLIRFASIIWPRLASAGVAAACSGGVLCLMPAGEWGDGFSLVVVTPLVVAIYAVCIRTLDRTSVDGITAMIAPALESLRKVFARAKSAGTA
jgi:hypothetical protein